MTVVAEDPDPRAAAMDEGLLFVLGRADDMRAEVYVRRADRADEGGPCVVTGTLAGPRCSLATTLPTTIRLVDLPGARPPTARGIVTEPSYWTPEMPNLYRLDARASAGPREVHCERLVGLRRLGVRGNSLWLEGRRWVPRAVACDAATFDMRSLHAASTAAVLVRPPESACGAADAAGVAIIAEVDAGSDADAARASLLEWSRHPAVVVAVVPATHAADVGGMRSVLGTMLIAVEVDGSGPPPKPPTGIDCLVVTLAPGASLHAGWRAGVPTLPLIARRKWGGGPPADRRHCDALQAELAAWSCAGSRAQPARDWAGYLVG